MEHKLESLGLMARGFAHDLNNLLTAMLGNAELARGMLPEGSKARELLADVRTAVLRASDLTQQMLVYSGRAKASCEDLDLGALVEGLRTLLESTIRGRSQLTIRAKDGVVTRGDRSQLRQLALALVANGAEAAGLGPGKVTVRVDAQVAPRDLLDQAYLGAGLEEGRYALLEVSDTGPGIAPHARDRIFDPFFTTRQKGRGLGLAAVAGIVRQHGGAIHVRTGPGGTTFAVLLPHG